MGRSYLCDVTGQPVAETDLTTLTITGPLAATLGRREVHLSRPVAAGLAQWLGHHGPDPQELLDGPPRPSLRDRVLAREDARRFKP